MTIGIVQPAGTPIILFEPHQNRIGFGKMALNTSVLRSVKVALRELHTECVVRITSEAKGEGTIRIERTSAVADTINKASAKAMLCRVQPASAADVQVDAHRVAIFTAVDSLKYRPARRATFDAKALAALDNRLAAGAAVGTAAAWAALLNQASYSFATHRRFYMWIGDPTALDSELPRRLPNTECSEPPSTAIYHARVLGMIALLLNERPRITSVMYVDADVWFSDHARAFGCCLPEAYSQLAPATSVAANGNHWKRPYGVFFNTGIMLWRNTRWSRGALALWWRSRCGWADQTALWSLLFATWANETRGRFAFVPKRLGTLKAAMRYAQPQLERQLGTDAFPSSLRWPDRAAAFTRSGALLKTLELPHVLLLPSTTVAGAPRDGGAAESAGGPRKWDGMAIADAVRDANRTQPTLPALASNVGDGGTFCCHTKPHARDPDNKCRGTDICTKGKCIIVGPTA